MKKINLLWEQFASEINCKAIGPPKTAEQWRHVLKEWKQNTKKKSRAIAENLHATGRGPHQHKTLTDLEEQLLALISKIHLGDTELTDSLILPVESCSSGIQKEISRGSVHVVYSYEDDEMADVNIRNFPQNDAPENQSGVSVEGVDKCTTKTDVITHTEVTPSKKKVVEERIDIEKKPKQGRYTTSILQSACESYKEAQKLIGEALESQSTNSKRLAVAVENLAECYKEAQHKRSNLEEKKLKLEYYKIFGTFEGFDEL